MLAALFTSALLCGCRPAASQHSSAPSPFVESPRHADPATASEPVMSNERLTCDGDAVLVAPATFTMGADKGDKWAAPIMVPRRRARVERPFCLDRTEVTTGAYERCVRSHQCTPTLRAPMCNLWIPQRDDHPINCVTWHQAVAFCTSRGARLPAEEEWELAARGPEGRTYPWGESEPRTSNDELWYPGADTTSIPVGSMPQAATPQGIEDLSGGVWEWTSSLACMHDDPRCKPGDERVTKGGTYSSPGANRFFRPRDTALSYVGFRCARSAGDASRARAAKAADPGPRRGPPSAARGTPSAARPKPLHWSLLEPRIEVAPKPPANLPFGGRTRVICMTRVVIDGEGTPRSAVAEKTTACALPFADVAESAVMRGRWWPTFGAAGAVSTIPVFIDAQPR